MALAGILQEISILVLIKIFKEFKNAHADKHTMLLIASTLLFSLMIFAPFCGK